MPEKPKKHTARFIIFSLIILLTEVVVFNLGLWQQGRAIEKEQAIQELKVVSNSDAVLFNPAGEVMPLQKITLTGFFDYDRTYYLENITHHEMRGRKVITPFVTMDGVEILVVQGWVKDKFTLTEQPQPTRITGITRAFPQRRGWLQGPVEGMEKNSLMFFDADAIATKNNFKRLPVWLELSESIHPEIESFSDMSPRLTPQRHREYMFTWFTLFSLLLVMYLYYVKVTFWRKSV